MNDGPRTAVPDADETDLQAWTLALARSWKLIAGVTVPAVDTAGVFTVLHPAEGASAVAPETPEYPRRALNLGVGAVLGMAGRTGHRPACAGG